MPIDSNSAIAAALFSRSRAQMATDAEAAANPFAHPNPIPPLPPVITATFPVRSKSGLELNGLSGIHGLIERFN